MCGVKPYMRATCNPDATSWVKRWLAPWVDKTYPLKAESGEILWMVRDGDLVKWFRRQEEAIEDAKELVDRLPVSDLISPQDLIKSVTFIFSNIYDNQIFLRENPQYLGSLLALPYVEKMRLLEGDWDVLPEAGKVFDRSWFEVIQPDQIPWTTDQNKAWDVRFWDFAASEKKTKGDDPDWTVGTRMRKHSGKYYVIDVVRFRATPGDLEIRVKNVASQDGDKVPIRWEEEGGSSGKIASHRLIEVLDGYDCRGIRPQGDKVARAMPLAAQAEAQNVKVVKSEWNEGWFTEMHHFPDAAHDDVVDSASGAYNYLKRFGADVTVGPDLWSS